jgi:septal ring factor EnvC (AmiA/AmiB activator)
MKIPDTLLCLLLLAATPVLGAVQQPMENDPQDIKIAEEDFKQLEEKMRVTEEDFNKLEKSMHGLQDTFAAIKFKQLVRTSRQNSSFESLLILIAL